MTDDLVLALPLVVVEGGETRDHLFLVNELEAYLTLLLALAVDLPLVERRDLGGGPDMIEVAPRHEGERGLEGGDQGVTLVPLDIGDERDPKRETDVVVDLGAHLVVI